MPLFVQRLTVNEPLVAPPLPGRFDEGRGLRVDGAGVPVAAGLAMPTRADQDRPDESAWETTGTKAMSDRDDETAFDLALMLSTRTAGGTDVDDDRALLSTTTFSGPDRDT